MRSTGPLAADISDGQGAGLPETVFSSGGAMRRTA